MHDEGTAFFAASIAQGNGAAEAAVRSLLATNRQLDKGNAQPGSLGADYGRLGLELWPALEARYPNRTKAQNGALDKLNRARNALAHGLDAPIRDLRADGYPLTLATFRRWRALLDSLATNIDDELAAQLGFLFGQPAPW